MHPATTSRWSPSTLKSTETVPGNGCSFHRRRCGNSQEKRKNGSYIPGKEPLTALFLATTISVNDSVKEETTTHGKSYQD